MSIPLRVLFCLVFIVPATASANGGGYRFGTKFTGSLAPFQPEGTEHIQIVEEQLDIVLGKSAAKVAVRYRMKNITDRKVSVRFGFPVEVIHQPYAPSLDTVTEGIEEKTALYCRDYIVGVDGKRIRHQYILEPFAFEKIARFPGSEVLDGIEGWMISELDFKKGQEREITIHYTSQYDIANYFISSRGNKGVAKFAYRLSTGGVWGGPIAKGTVTIRTDGIFADEVTVKSPADRFQKTGDTWRWEFENLEPTLADDIAIEAIPGTTSYKNRGDKSSITYTERLGVWNAEHSEFTAIASSSLPTQDDFTYGHFTYGPENVADKNSNTAWSEGVEGDGIGEHIELKPDIPAPLSWISIRNGYVSSDDQFRANNRVKTLTISLNGEHSFDAGLEDAKKSQDIHIRGYNKPVSSIRLTIKEIYPGNKFRDTCITRIALARRLAKKPEIRGAR